MTPLRLILLSIATALLAVQPVTAQSLLRDAETEEWLHDLASPLAEAAGLDPDNVELVLVNDPSLNAFVIGGQTVYVHSGTILQADSANQIQGIIAHELGHIAGGHAVRFSSEGARGATGISILSLVAAVGAMAAGAPDAGMALLGLGTRAATGTVLAFNRQQEARTDQAGARYLNEAGISGRGLLEFYQKLDNQEMRLSVPQDETTAYIRTHPSPQDRIATLRDLLQKSAAWDAPTDAELEAKFKRIQGKLHGFAEDPARTLRLYPPSDTSAAARVARAYAYHQGAFVTEAAAETDALLQENPHDPYVLELKGQVLLESGRPEDAIAPLEASIEAAPDQPLISALLGHALVATDDNARLPRAVDVLRSSVRQDRYNPFAWYQLGVAYSRLGDEPRAALATAERHALLREPELALRSARAAMEGIPQGSPDWLRAQDILLVAENEIAERDD